MTAPRNNTWSMHEICGLERTTTLATIGRLDDDTLAALQLEAVKLQESGWPDKIEAKDIELADQYGFDVVAANDISGDHFFVRFGSAKRPKVFREAFFALHPSLKGRESDIEVFETYFAHVHSDNLYACRGQLNLILTNPAGHRILSIDRAGRHHLVAPKAGDVVFLDTCCKHAVLPDQSKGIAHMRENPMRAAFVTLPDQYD